MIEVEKDFTFHRRHRDVTYHAELSWPDNCPESVKQIIRDAMSLHLINNIARERKLITDREHGKMSVMIHGQTHRHLQQAIQREQEADHAKE